MTVGATRLFTEIAFVTFDDVGSEKEDERFFEGFYFVLCVRRILCDCVGKAACDVRRVICDVRRVTCDVRGHRDLSSFWKIFEVIVTFLLYRRRRYLRRRKTAAQQQQRRLDGAGISCSPAGVKKESRRQKGKRWSSVPFASSSFSIRLHLY